MNDKDDDEARATGLIINQHTSETLGFVYTWEDGGSQPFWVIKKSHRTNVLCVSLQIGCRPKARLDPGNPT